MKKIKIAKTAKLDKILKKEPLIKAESNVSQRNLTANENGTKNDEKGFTKKLNEASDALNPFKEKVDEREKITTYDKDLCVICFDAKPNALYKPCDHGGLCKKCSIENFDLRKKCHLCRKILNYVVVYAEGENGKLYQIEQYPPIAIIS